MEYVQYIQLLENVNVSVLVASPAQFKILTGKQESTTQSRFLNLFKECHYAHNFVVLYTAYELISTV